MEEKICHICGRKLKDDEIACKKCNAEESEIIIADCRGIRYANSFIISAYVNLVLTNKRLLAFEDIKGALVAGAIAGVAGGVGGVAGQQLGAALGRKTGDPIARPVAKGINGSIKFQAPLGSLKGVDHEIKKNVVHYFIQVADAKPLRIVLGNSFDGVVTGDMFIQTLIETIAE